MRATPALLYKGFWGRSLDEFKRLSSIALHAEGTQRAMKPKVLAQYHEAKQLEDVKILCDSDGGGFSTAKIEWIPPSSNPTPPSSENKNGHMKFSGNISMNLPPDKPDFHRSGYAAWRTKDRPPTIFGKAYWDVDMYAYLALRIKSDGRKYFVNLQTETIVYTDIHQHRLYARKPGEWETILIKWNEFVRTNHGMVVEPQNEMQKQKLLSVGIGLTDRVLGPFELCVDRIWATNEMTPEDRKEDARPLSDGELTDKHGKRIKWGKIKATS